MLCRRTCEIEPLQTTLNQILAAAKEKEDGILASEGRLFEIEADNLHQEPLLAAQLASQALAEATARIPKGTSDAAKILAWGRQAAFAVRDAVKTCPQGWECIIRSESTSELEAAFFPVYCLVLAMWAAAHCNRGEERYRGEIRGIIREINKRKAFSRGLGRQPLLRAVWSATVHEWLGSIDDTASKQQQDVGTKGKLLWRPTYFLPDIVPELHLWELELLVQLELHEAAAQRSRGPSLHCTII